jgi:hypothetical protein
MSDDRIQAVADAIRRAQGTWITDYVTDDEEVVHIARSAIAAADATNPELQRLRELAWTAIISYEDNVRYKLYTDMLALREAVEAVKQ